MQSRGKVKRIRLSDIILVLFFTIAGIVTIYPLWYCVVGSVLPAKAFMDEVLFLWPKEFTLDAYKFIFEQGKIFSPLLVTTFITVVGTAANIFITTLVAYGLSKKFPGSTLIMYLIVLTMFINVGLIPNYLLFKELHLINTLAVYIVPSLINAFYLIIMRTFFQNFSREIEEAAYMDGAGELSIFFRIIIPLSTPVIAAILLFTAVDYWNTFAQSLYFVTDTSKKTLQDYLFMMLDDRNVNTGGASSLAVASMSGMSVTSMTLKLANTVLSIIPILLVYPFLQKYFATGLMIGSVKG